MTMAASALLACRALAARVPTCPLFSMQLVVSVAGLGLSVGMLVAGRDPAVYLPVLTSIVGYWLPAPSRPRERGGESTGTAGSENARGRVELVEDDTARTDDIDEAEAMDYTEAVDETNKPPPVVHFKDAWASVARPAT